MLNNLSIKTVHICKSAHDLILEFFCVRSDSLIPTFAYLSRAISRRISHRGGYAVDAPRLHECAGWGLEIFADAWKVGRSHQAGAMVKTSIPDHLVCRARDLDRWKR